MPQGNQAVHPKRDAIIGSFYSDQKDEKKIVDKDLFDKKAQEIANRLWTEKQNQHTGRRYPIGISITQLRRIFDEVKRFEHLLQLNDDEWDKQLPYIKMIKSKIRYAVARAKKNSSRDVHSCYDFLASFISEGIDCIREQQDYEVFLGLFEAVYGFYYEHAPNRG